MRERMSGRNSPRISTRNVFYQALRPLLAFGAVDWDWIGAEGDEVGDLLLGLGFRGNLHLWNVFHCGGWGIGVVGGVCGWGDVV